MRNCNREVGDVFSNVSKFFVLLSAILGFSMVAAAPSLAKQNFHHYSYPPEPAYEAVYEPAQFWYEDRKGENQYSQPDSYFQGFFYHLWYWLWANIVPVIIIVLITWIFFRLYYSAVIK